MNRDIIAAVLLSGVCGVSVASECNTQTMDELTLKTCITVEGSGQSWSSYQKDMRELEASILGERLRKAQAEQSSVATQ